MRKKKRRRRRIFFIMNSGKKVEMSKKRTKYNAENKS